MLFDLETTGLDVYTAEIIEGYFHVFEDGSNEILSSYHLKAQPTRWDYESEKIHKINYTTAMSYPVKCDALREFLRWFSSYVDHDKYCYANPNQMGAYVTYDYAVIRMQLWDVSDDHNLFYRFFKSKTNNNMYLTVKDADRKGLIDVHRSKETNRKSFTQENVYNSMFNEIYNAHEAKEDVLALKRIYLRLKELDELPNDIFRSNTHKP